MVLERTRKHLERYIEIGKILARHSWDSFIGRLGLARIFHMRGYVRGVPPTPVQVRQAIEELGPTFIKLGQILSTRPDMVPTDYLIELEKLQDMAPQVPFAQIREQIESEFGVPLESVFIRFDEKPFAAASLGQAHEATLPDGKQVVVKVQRPGIRTIIESDLEIIAGVARFLDRHVERARALGLPDLVDEFSISIRQELDYTREGRNGDLLKSNLSRMRYILIPQTIWNYTTPRVLALEKISGVKVTDTAELEAKGNDKYKVVRNLWRAFLQMIFVDGFFHGDPHPGNIVVLDNDVVALLDFGMVGRLDHELRTNVTLLLSEYAAENSRGFSDTLLEIGTSPSDLDRNQFRSEIDRLLRQYYGAPLRAIKIGEALSRAVRISTKHNVRLPSSLALLVKVILGIEGINRTLVPDYDMTAEVRSFITTSVIEELSPTTMRMDLLRSLVYWKSLVTRLPHRTAQVLERMAEGTFRVVFKHDGLEAPTRDIDRSANRLSFALIAAATILASAQILSANVGPLWRGYSVFGLVGFAISFFFGVWLLISIIRAGKLW